MTQPPNQQPQWWQPPSGPPSGGQPAQWQPGHPPAPQYQQAPPPPGPAPLGPRQGQFGGGFQPAHYGGLGAFPEDIRITKKKSKKPLVFGAIGVIVLLGAGAVAWLLGAFSGDTLEQNSLQDGVSQVLKESYGEQDVKNVSCPSGQPIKAGTTFDCSAQVAGRPKQITVRVLNDSPEFEVGAPH
jgi:hypothetical protein